MIKNIRNAFIAGILVLLPISVTLVVINFLIDKIGSPSSKLFFATIDPNLRAHPGINLLLDAAAVLIVVLLITGVGLFSNYFFGRLFIKATEKIIERLPFISVVYKTVKQIVDTFSEQNKAVFQKCVLVEYPRKGMYSLGFLTSENDGETQVKTGQVVVNVFVPTTPNPTSGYLLMVPKEDIILLDMSIGDGMKLVISGGAVVPSYDKNKNQINLDFA